MKLLDKLFPPYDREADLARVKRNRFELLETLDNLFHKLGDPTGFQWICDRYDRALVKAGEPSMAKIYGAENDPLTLAVNRAFNTGEIVFWEEGDPLPDPEGPIRPLDE